MKNYKKSYKELIKLKTYKERVEYLKCGSQVGASTFGFDRYINQIFYRSPEWKRIRRQVILRDKGCDLGLDGYEIPDRIYIHHINSITMQDIIDRDPKVFDLDNLIAVSFETHNAIHYGTEPATNKCPIERTLNDTCPWRR